MSENRYCGEGGWLEDKMRGDDKKRELGGGWEEGGNKKKIVVSSDRVSSGLHLSLLIETSANFQSRNRYLWSS